VYGRDPQGLATWVSGDSTLVSASVFAYADVMYATAVVDGKVVRFKLSPALARAHRENRGKTMTEREAVRFVEARRRARALRRARPYLESRS
jgi:adenylylsulfate kinase-like enzyme